MKKQQFLWTLFVAVVALTISACCAKFETLTTGTKYHVGDTFTDAGKTFELVQFYWYNNDPAPSGEAEVWTRNWSGGTGKEIFTNNINVRFVLNQTVQEITFNAGHLGGNMNMEINGVTKNFNQVSDINGQTIAGVMITCTGGYNVPGVWEFKGPITSFYVGGQEFGIDNVCIK